MTGPFPGKREAENERKETGKRAAGESGPLQLGPLLKKAEAEVEKAAEHQRRKSLETEKGSLPLPLEKNLPRPHHLRLAPSS